MNNDFREEMLRMRREAADKLAEIDREFARFEPEEVSTVSQVEFRQEPSTFEWLVGGLIARRSVSMLVADPGLGKTTLMAQLLLSVANGKSFIGAPAAMPKHVLYIPAEGSREAFNRRLETTRVAMGVDPSYLWHVPKPEARDYQIGGRGLRKLLKDSHAELAVFDTLGYFANGLKENDATDWKAKVANPLRGLVDELDCAVVLVHHPPKVTEANRDARDGRGSSAMLADVDHFWRLEEVRGEPILRDLVVRKNKYGAAATYRLAFDAGNALFRVVG